MGQLMSRSLAELRRVHFIRYVIVFSLSHVLLCLLNRLPDKICTLNVLVVYIIQFRFTTKCNLNHFVLALFQSLCEAGPNYHIEVRMLY